MCESKEHVEGISPQTVDPGGPHRGFRFPRSFFFFPVKALNYEHQHLNYRTEWKKLKEQFTNYSKDFQIKG